MRLSIQLVACGAERIARSEEVWLPDVWWDEVVVVLPSKDSVNISKQLSIVRALEGGRGARKVVLMPDTLAMM